MTPPPDTAAGDAATGGRPATVAPARAMNLEATLSGNGRVELFWGSEAGQRYVLWEATELSDFAADAGGLLATPPLNRWWVDSASLRTGRLRLAQLEGGLRGHERAACGSRHR